VNLPPTSPIPRSRRALATIALVSSLVLTAAVSAGTASAAQAPPSAPTADAPHCLTRVTSRTATGELLLSTPECHATFAAVVERSGRSVTSQSITPAQAHQQGLVGVAAGGGGMTTMSDTWLIGTHFDGANYTGASISVEGSDCYGGYINLTGWWANRVSSTINGCPAIVHYYWPDLGGTNETTYNFGGNLSGLNNLSESIAYTGW
jgi:hypothetical protein